MSKLDEFLSAYAVRIRMNAVQALKHLSFPRLKSAYADRNLVRIRMNAVQALKLTDKDDGSWLDVVFRGSLESA